MRIKDNYLLLSIILFVLLVGVLLVARFMIGGDEDSWIKDARGVYIKHGNPQETPAAVSWQHAGINCAYDLFDNFTGEINSQCLGICGNYAVDIVHVPRTAEDDEIGNQCSEYGTGIVNYFIELDKNREIVRIA